MASMWTEEQVSELVERAPWHPYYAASNLIGKSIRSVNSFRQQLKQFPLRIPQRFMMHVVP